MIWGVTSILDTSMECEFQCSHYRLEISGGIVHSSTSSENTRCVKGPTLCARDTSAEVMNQMHTLLVLPAVAAGLCPASFGDTLVFMGILRDSLKYSFIIQDQEVFSAGNIRNLPQVDAAQDQEIPMAWRFGCGDLAIPNLWETTIAGWNIPMFNKKYIFKESIFPVLC